ncbi:MAG: ATP-binding cassette domain-containing protein [Chitinophagaceae bacterium]|nr:ATP-binding cassette domain-containing protein [Chitinophagaceae bacterium]
MKNAEELINIGEIWAVTGESGSGHSELLQQLDTKKAERVSFRHNFRNLSNTTDFYYQQRYNALDSDDAPTVSEHLSNLSGNPGYWTQEKIIEKFNLTPLLDEQVIKLSNGETKRVLIGSALIKNPEILLLDHPLTGLDINTRKEFTNLLNEITRSGIRILIATTPFDIPEAVTHIAVMKNSAIIHRDIKEKFNPKAFDFIHEININEQALKELLTGSTITPFNIIVGMKNVTISYDDRAILDNINWMVKQGERWVLSGPNGAGKSTLLSLITGDNPQAYANDIILFDRKRGTGESIWDIKKQTGFVSPELYQYFPTDSSCLHVIESGFYDTIGLFRATDPEKEKICIRWMELLQIDKYVNIFFNRVPGSVQRLCLLARALVKNPALMILDEPTQGLDSFQQQYFTRLIELIGRLTNVTIIYVSHYQQHIPNNIKLQLQLKNGKQL